MPSPEPTAFERVYPRRSLLGGPGLRGLLWSVASSVCVCLLLLLLGLLADFLAQVREGKSFERPVATRPESIWGPGGDPRA